MQDFTLTIKINTAVKKVYEALLEQNHLKSWWTTNCRADPVIGGINKFDFKPNIEDGGFCVMKNTTLELNKIVWDCIVGIMGSSQDEWSGTQVIFELEEQEGKTTLNLLHKGLNNSCDCFEGCSKGWKFYVGKSLKEYLEIGKGEPYEG